MALEITVPQLGKVKKTSKDLVVSALIYNHPTTLIKLTNIIKRKFHASFTFQGVRKAVNQLVIDEVVVKAGREYSLSKDWILKLREFTEKLHESYFAESTGIRNIEAAGRDIKVYTFDNLVDLDIFWNSLIGKWFDEDRGVRGDKFYVQQSGHTWYVLANLEEETQILGKILKYNIKFFTLAAGNAVLDKWCKRYYENHGFYYVTSKKKTDASHYFAVYNDHIIQCTYPMSLVEELNNIYRNAKDFESFDVAKLIRLLRKKTELKMTVMKNPVVAEQLKKHILSHFDKKCAAI